MKRRIEIQTSESEPLDRVRVTLDCDVPRLGNFSSHLYWKEIKYETNYRYTA
jgi:hypothetical protein